MGRYVAIKQEMDQAKNKIRQKKYFMIQKATNTKKIQ